MLGDMTPYSVERRAPGQRRWGLTVEYPLVDSQGMVVLTDRRRVPDRRQDRPGRDRVPPPPAGWPPD